MADKKKLLKYAVDYLSKYNSSKKNLERIIKNKILRMKIEKKYRFELYNMIPQILDDLEKNNLINDNNYSWSKINFLIQSGKSKNFIINYLRNRGINTKIIDKILKEKEEENLDWEIQSARKFFIKKHLLKKIENRQKNLSKMSRAGFSYEISKKILDEN